MGINKYHHHLFGCEDTVLAFANIASPDGTSMAVQFFLHDLSLIDKCWFVLKQSNDTSCHVKPDNVVHGEIYKSDNMFDRAIADYKQGEEIAREAQRIEIDLIETEHEIWMLLSR
jgi:hypothetical protein